jgi:Tub family
MDTTATINKPEAAATVDFDHDVTSSAVVTAISLPHNLYSESNICLLKEEEIDVTTTACMDRNNGDSIADDDVDNSTMTKNDSINLPNVETSIVDDFGTSVQQEDTIPTLFLHPNGVYTKDIVLDKLNTLEGEANEEGTTTVLAVAADIVVNILTTSTPEPVELLTNQQLQPDIQSLPLDALHCIASFLTPQEWCYNFGTLNAGTRVQCRTVLQRVYMHAYKCATEIITAWKLYEQWEDAHELAALYIQAGVPIYPYCLGHAYHTLNWRMNVEANEILNQNRTDNAELDTNHATSHGENRTSGTTTDTTTATVVVGDPFFGTTRINHRLGREYTYLEEKCHFYVREDSNRGNSTHDRSNGTTNSHHNNHSMRMIGHQNFTLNHPSLPSRTGTRPLSLPNRLTGNTVGSLNHHSSSTATKVPLVIHQHLHDRHQLQHEYFVDTQDGKMKTPIISLSADFFHPSPTTKNIPARNTSTPHSSNSNARADIVVDTSTVTDLPTDQPAINGWSHSRFNSMEIDDESSDLAPLVLEEEHHQHQGSSTSILSLVDLDVYSSSMISSIHSMNSNFQDVRRHLLSRFATYQRRLETYLLKGDTYAYEECMLDFWDEFFPHTSGIHYHDMETAVPRITCMHKFLTKPCPKAIGVVQCEIERIKTTTRGKGVKGRLFPTYEYRLFIRHRPLPHQINGNSDSATLDANTSDSNDNDNISHDFVRRDTVLMVAKHRGRKHTEHNGIVQLSGATSKKGSNNYYLYMPQQMDVDEHFRKCNEDLLERKKKSVSAWMEPNGASRYPVMVSNHDLKANLLLGRLQSNFIGTEFQIFTPRIKKLPRRKMDASGLIGQLSQPFHSEDELDYDSGVSSDNNNGSSSRRPRFSRFRRSAGGTATSTAAAAVGQHFASNSDSGSVGSTPVMDYPKIQRTWSSPENLQSTHHVQQQQQRHTRISRRAIANDSNVPPSSSSPQEQSLSLFEEEAGAITYTANLLGSRPRIMDVCVPKVTCEGIVGLEWRQYLDSCDDDMDEYRMISCFRQLQHRRENQGLQTPPIPINNADNLFNPDGESDTGGEHNETDFGLLALQNRPPWWNVELGSFVLNFGGRVSVASVKNFQLCERTNQDIIMLQFGRIHGRHSFTMDFRHPLTAVQAFSIAISSLQSKISFG